MPSASTFLSGSAGGACACLLTSGSCHVAAFLRQLQAATPAVAKQGRGRQWDSDQAVCSLLSCLLMCWQREQGIVSGCSGRCDHDVTRNNHTSDDASVKMPVMATASMYWHDASGSCRNGSYDCDGAVMGYCLSQRQAGRAGRPC